MHGSHLRKTIGYRTQKRLILRQSSSKFASNTQNQRKSAIHKHVRLGSILSVITIGAFTFLAAQIQGQGLNSIPFDRAVIAWIHHRQEPWLTDLSLVLAGVGSTGMMIAIAIAGVAAGVRWPRLRDMAWTMPIAAAGAGAIILTAKAIFHRHRPTFFPPIMPATGYSFPSGHSLFAMSVYGMLGYFLGTLTRNPTDRRWIHASTLLLIAMVGLSRIYLGVHYPTDVLAGWSLGVPWLVICIVIREALGRTLHKPTKLIKPRLLKRRRPA